MKRRIKIFLVLTTIFMFGFALLGFMPKADALTFLKTEYIDIEGDLEETNLLGGIKLYKQKIKSYYDGITDPIR